jgi:hypothetical protein
MSFGFQHECLVYDLPFAVQLEHGHEDDVLELSPPPFICDSGTL